MCGARFSGWNLGDGCALGKNLGSVGEDSWIAMHRSDGYSKKKEEKGKKASWSDDCHQTVWSCKRVKTSSAEGAEYCLMMS